MPKFYLSRIRLNQGGYDSTGYYWGVGQPLYGYTREWEHSPDEYVDDAVRADNREHAKAKVLAKYPDAQFHR